MTASDGGRVSRRTTLGWLSGAMAISANGLVLSATARAAEPTPRGGARGYGNDANPMNPHVPWPRTLSPAHLRQVAVLTDIILPKDGDYPAASEVGIPDFVDEWVSAPYPDQQRDRALLLSALPWLDQEARKAGAADFVGLPAAEQTRIVARISKPAPAGDAAAEQLNLFFKSLRTITVGAYYSLPQNFPEIGYIGNQPLEAFPPPTPEENAFIDKAIASLGL